MFRTENPIADADRYYEEQEKEYIRLNETAHCECCGRACGAEIHYRLFGNVVVCSMKCAKDYLDQDDREQIIEDWVEDQMVDAGSESCEW
nr:hypothetical protein [Clostridia bacterium]